jgi:hypothetical protein
MKCRHFAVIYEWIRLIRKWLAARLSATLFKGEWNPDTTYPALSPADAIKTIQTPPGTNGVPFVLPDPAAARAKITSSS